MALLQELFSVFSRSHSRFKTGDHVQSREGGPLMIVQWTKIDKKTKAIILNCKWFDNESKSTRTNLFLEDELVPFDWHNP